MAKIVCPHCQHRMSSKTLKPGTYKPKCTSCQQPFGVKVPEDVSDESVLVGQPLSSDSSANTSRSKTHIPADQTRIEPSSQQPNPRPIGKTGAQSNSQTNQPTRPQSSVPVPSRPAQPSASIQAKSANTANAAEQTRNDPSEPVRQTSRTPPRPQVSAETPIPERLGGYRIISELGRGGLGVVYLANQLSLQRHVALKVIRTGLARNATVIARFIREAYAAAQLTHHNVVQIIDLGADRDTNFFSMEFVEGQSLADWLKDNRRMPVEQAAGYVLQAARGLLFAHTQGMVHRDIKPANLMLSNAGIVKVADLGLVKVAAEDLESDDAADPVASTLGLELTSFGTTLGTANYMAPEQADDSSSVDHRADIYSLGCTFYALLTGSPPFKGNSVEEIRSKHKLQPVPQLSPQLQDLPPAVNSIITKMMAKRPEDRYQSLSETISDLEKLLGLESGKAFQPKESDVKELERINAQFQGASLVGLRRWTPVSFFGVIVLLMILLAIFRISWVLPMMLFVVSATATALLACGLSSGAFWMERTREWIWQQRINAIAFLGIGVFLLGALSWLAGTMALGVFAIVLGLAAGLGYWGVVFRGLAGQRKESIDMADRFLKRLRISGVDEGVVQLFFAKYSNDDWEELFEAMFGYAAKQKMRGELLRLAGGSRKKKFRPWIDWYVSAIERRLDRAKKAADQAKLALVEQAALRQQGLSAEEAAAQAEYLAEALVADAVGIRSRALSPGVPIDANQAAEEKRNRIKKMLAEAKSGRHVRPKGIWRRLDPILGPWLGAPIRLACGVALLVCFGMWVKHNLDLSTISQDDAQEAASKLLNDEGAGVTELASRIGLNNLWGGGRPLEWPLVGTFFSGFGPLIAGLFLVGTGILGGWRLSIFSGIGAAIVLCYGALGLPNYSVVGGQLGLASIIGSLICLIGVAFKED